MYLENKLTQNYVNSLANCIENELEYLVSIDSQVGNESGITKAQHYTVSLLEKLDFKVSYHYGAFTAAPLIHGFKPGKTGEQTITFIGHNDVVTSVDKVPFHKDSQYIYGAGVADCKGGVIVCLDALENFFNTIDAHNFNINILISPNEETGSLGFHDYFAKIGEQSQFVFGLEPALSSGQLICSRSGNRWYELRVQGISAHSGRFGFEHINAAHGLSKIISSLHELNDDARMRRVNVGSLGGGNGGFNTLCGDAWAKIDTRFTSFEDRDSIHTKIELALEKHILTCPISQKKLRAFYSIEDDCPPMEKSSDSYNWFSVYCEQLKILQGAEVNAIHAGGAADINYFASPRNQLLDGLGPIGGNLHTKNEYIERNSLVHKSMALTHFLKWLNVSKWLMRRQ